MLTKGCSDQNSDQGAFPDARVLFYAGQDLQGITLQRCIADALKVLWRGGIQHRKTADVKDPEGRD